MGIGSKLPFGLRSGKLVHISELNVEERGFKCNCNCPSCGDKLIARMGEQNIKHFAHSNSDCKNGVESALHLWTKELIKKANQIILPRLSIEYSEVDTKEEDIQLDGTIDKFKPRTDWRYGYVKTLEICKPELKTFDEIKEEVHLGDIIPDLLVKINGVPLIIEIAVTHYVDDIKKAKIINKNISAFEIDLSDCIKNINSLSKQELAKIILLEHNNKKWIYNRRTKQNIVKVLEQNSEIRERKKREEVEREKKKQQELEEEARANNKTAICKICNKETTKWTAYYGKEKSCKCRECYANEPW
ncbi:MAG: competence protein CoiA family protein [Clostridium sp.]